MVSTAEVRLTAQKATNTQRKIPAVIEAAVIADNAKERDAMPPRDYDLSWLPLEDISDQAGQEVGLSINISFHSTTGNILDVKFYPYTLTPDEGVLEVTFHNGTYRYFDVPLSTAQGFSYASSATLYLNDQIKNVFDYEGE